MNEYLESFYVAMVLSNKKISIYNRIDDIGKFEELSIEIDDEIMEKTPLFYYNRISVTETYFQVCLHYEYKEIFIDAFKNRTNRIKTFDDRTGRIFFYVYDTPKNLVEQLGTFDRKIKEIADYI